MKRQPHPLPTVRYGGFWIRFLAYWIDVLLLIMIILPIFLWMDGLNPYATSQKFGQDYISFFLSYVFPVIATLIFWHYRSATPGKMICRLIIADAESLQKPTTRQFVIRYFAYIVSIIPFFLGFLWIAFDKRKQGWHDKIAKTVVIRKS